MTPYEAAVTLWLTVMAWLLILPDGRRALADLLTRAWTLLRWPTARRTPQLEPPTRCTCTGADRGELVPVESVVTGEVLTHRCPTCWAPRPQPPSGPGAVVTLPPGFRFVPLPGCPHESGTTELRTWGGGVVRAMCDSCGASLPVSASTPR